MEFKDCHNRYHFPLSHWLLIAQIQNKPNTIPVMKRAMEELATLHPGCYVFEGSWMFADWNNMYRCFVGPVRLGLGTWNMLFLKINPSFPHPLSSEYLHFVWI